MVFYCRHDLDYFNKFKDKEYLGNDFKCSPIIVCLGCIEQYNWIKSQMKKRLKNYDGENLLWLWTKLPNEKRQWGENEKGKTFVVLEVNIPREDVLFSDFKTWEMILKESQILEYKEESIDKKESWERVFDLKWLKKYGGDYTKVEIIQGTTGKIPMKNIKIVRYESENKLL